MKTEGNKQKKAKKKKNLAVLRPRRAVSFDFSYSKVTITEFKISVKLDVPLLIFKLSVPRVINRAHYLGVPARVYIQKLRFSFKHSHGSEGFTCQTRGPFRTGFLALADFFFPGNKTNDFVLYQAPLFVLALFPLWLQFGFSIPTNGL